MLVTAGSARSSAAASASHDAGRSSGGPVRRRAASRDRPSQTGSVTAGAAHWARVRASRSAAEGGSPRRTRSRARAVCSRTSRTAASDAAPVSAAANAAASSDPSASRRSQARRSSGVDSRSAPAGRVPAGRAEARAHRGPGRPERQRLRRGPVGRRPRLHRPASRCAGGAGGRPEPADPGRDAEPVRDGRRRPRGARTRWLDPRPALPRPTGTQRSPGRAGLRLPLQRRALRPLAGLAAPVHAAHPHRLGSGRPVLHRVRRPRLPAGRPGRGTPPSRHRPLRPRNPPPRDRAPRRRVPRPSRGVAGRKVRRSRGRGRRGRR
ncbi:hypothetical protein BS35_007012 [Actinomadura glauciflava]|nr:hypothetical protein [Actinomadura glauciflava]